MIKEEFLHYIWQFQNYKSQDLLTTDNERVEVVKPGVHNVNSGPDFFNAKIYINKQLWVGNVELHVKSSDWYWHKHDEDSNYQNVILHVVWEDDAEVQLLNGSKLPTVVLKPLVDAILIKNYHKLKVESNQWLVCQSLLNQNLPPFLLNHYYHRLYLNRLEAKLAVIKSLLDSSNNDWEAVLFKLICKSFGAYINQDAFLNLANSFSFQVLRKVRQNKTQLEALLLGQAGFLNEEFTDVYAKKLKVEYEYLKHKFQLIPLFKGQFQFFRLRPANFPTIRLAQLAGLYHNRSNLFDAIQASQNVKELHSLFNIDVSPYWLNHYRLDKKSKSPLGVLGNSTIKSVIINAVIPFKYWYDHALGKQSYDSTIELLSTIDLEQNQIIAKFRGNGIMANNAFETQALLQLYKQFCQPKHCLKCEIGSYLLKGPKSVISH